MKALTLIRHAKSSWDDLSLADHDRPLNKRGKRDAPFMAQLMASRGWRPDLLLSSTAVRAYTTALHFAEALGLPPQAIRREARIYEASVLQLQYLVQELSKEHQHVAFFGHNPGLGILANNIPQEGFIGNLPTCGIVEITAPITDWTNFKPEEAQMLAFHYPKQYK